jgi:DNA adenine methylase
MKFYSPLRYPGGKAFLASELERIISAIKLDRPVYVEPYAGGAGAALSLLFADKVKKIVINDLDNHIYAFWKSVTNEPERFIQKILTTKVTITEWRKQKLIYLNKKSSIFEKGFATFFLNRTNRSGIMNAGPIGGMKQSGLYKMNARYNKKELAARILKIGGYKNRIIVLNEDGIELTKKYLERDNTFIYLDPPYFKKGALLYLNHYKLSNHEELAKLLNKNHNKYWVLTYDEVQEIRNLYLDKNRRRLALKYRVHDSHKARNSRELMFFSNPISIAYK